jgi:large subunit ribosomal protein L24e
MANCSFCGKALTPGTGKIFVQNTGKILYFDSSKCEKNMLKLKRKNTKFKWTKFYEKGKK